MQSTSWPAGSSRFWCTSPAFSLPKTQKIAGSGGVPPPAPPPPAFGRAPPKGGGGPGLIRIPSGGQSHSGPLILYSKPAHSTAALLPRPFRSCPTSPSGSWGALCLARPLAPAWDSLGRGVFPWCPRWLSTAVRGAPNSLESVGTVALRGIIIPILPCVGVCTQRQAVCSHAGHVCKKPPNM